MKQQLDNSQWDNYWSQGNIHSLSTAFSGNYDGAISAFWKQQFATLEDNSVILDVGTGNGGIAFLAAEAALENNKKFNIYGMDLADIDPQKAVKLHPELLPLIDSIEFLGKTSVTKLPYPENHFDFIIGQYSLEYTPIEQALPELRRVLKPSGRMSFAVHHQDSVVMATTRDELTQAKILFDQSKLFIRAKSLVKAMGDVSSKLQKSRLKSNPVAEKKRNALNTAFAQVYAEVENRVDGNFLLTAIDYIKQVFAPENNQSMKQKLEFLSSSQQIIKANQKRLEDLYRACFNDEDIKKFNLLCAQYDFAEPKFSPFHNEDGHLLAWKLLI